MKGLLLKDLYMMKHYCRTYLLIAIVFFAISFFDDGNMLFVIYPCLVCGMIPVNLLSYDERSHFLQYSATLPCTRAQVVSGKYLIGLGIQVAVLVLTGIVQGIKMAMNGSFSVGALAGMLAAVLMVSALSSSIPMPFIFKSGVEKGRIGYYVMIAFVCAASVVLSDFMKSGLAACLPGGLSVEALFAVIAVLGIAAYALSWYLSVAAFKKREI